MDKLSAERNGCVAYRAAAGSGRAGTVTPGPARGTVGAGARSCAPRGPIPPAGRAPRAAASPPPSFPGLGMSPQVPPARPKRSAVLPGAEPLCTPSGQFTEPCVARPSWSLHKQTGLLRRFPSFRPRVYFRKTGRQSTCGFTSGEFGVLSHPQSNVVNRHGFKMALNYWQHIKY